MKIIIFIMCFILLLLYGCGQEATVRYTIQNNTKYQEEKMQVREDKLEEKAMIMELLNCDEEKAEKIEVTFQEVSGKRIDNVENVPTDKKSYLVKVEADGEIYYLKITSKYFLSEIRADKEDGEVLYQVVY